ncbi:MAG: tetratricopeptide repeat protein [Phycisphaerales bacterium]|nr:tetratricopeptide repeat protein [Phycisphaerales bacterium]
MGLTIRHVVLVSAVLSVGSFVYAVGFAPIDPENNPRAQALNRTPSRQGLVNLIRRSITLGQVTAADRSAARYLDLNPEDPYAHFYRAIVYQLMEKPEAAREVWENLDHELSDISKVEGRYSQGQLDYLRGWSKFGIGETEASQAYFKQIADQIEERASGNDLSSGAHYNLACYRAKEGKTEQAMQHFEQAIELGYQRDAGWWAVDPDLQPLHNDPRFWDVGLSIDDLSRDRRTPTQNPD